MSPHLRAAPDERHDFPHGGTLREEELFPLLKRRQAQRASLRESLDREPKGGYTARARPFDRDPGRSGPAAIDDGLDRAGHEGHKLTYPEPSPAVPRRNLLGLFPGGELRIVAE